MDLPTVLLAATTVGVALIAGIFAAFSIAVLPALRRLPPATAAAVMQAVNRAILNPLFLLPYLGTTVACVVLPFLGVTTPAVLVGCGLHLAGGFLLTGTVNVPLNNDLDRRDARDPATWSRFATRWTGANHLRTAACLASACLLATGL